MRAVYWRARVTSRASFTIWLYACVASSFLFLSAAYGEEPGTPLAGEAFHADLLGLPIDFPERDRRHVTAVNFGVQWIPHGPIQLQVLPLARSLSRIIGTRNAFGAPSRASSMM